MIDEIPDITCIPDVEIIDLSHNKLKHIYNTTFDRLLRLRNLDLSYNDIKTIDPNSFQGKGRSIANINLSGCKLTEIDVSNFILENGFCEINFDSNSITTMTNLLDFKVKENTTYGEGGRVSFENCSLTQFVNFTDLGVDPINKFHKYFDIEFDTKGSVIGCDCVLFKLFETTFSYLERTWVDYRESNGTIECTTPEKLKGRQVHELVYNKPLRDEMICEVAVDCPKQCKCYDQPSFKTISC